jgi:hypothetical protein
VRHREDVGPVDVVRFVVLKQVGEYRAGSDGLEHTFHSLEGTSRSAVRCIEA